jgi:hypothetical protein
MTPKVLETAGFLGSGILCIPKVATDLNQPLDRKVFEALNSIGKTK